MTWFGSTTVEKPGPETELTWAPATSVVDQETMAEPARRETKGPSKMAQTAGAVALGVEVGVGPPGVGVVVAVEVRPGEVVPVAVGVGVSITGVAVAIAGVAVATTWSRRAADRKWRDEARSQNDGAYFDDAMCRDTFPWHQASGCRDAHPAVLSHFRQICSIVDSNPDVDRVAGILRERPFILGPATDWLESRAESGGP
jgi:hypothetical protein